MTALCAAGALLAGVACGAANVRPYLTPFPEAPLDTLRGDAAAITTFLAERLTARGIALRLSSAPEGYLETQWFDARGDSGDTLRLELSPVVKLRFWVDPIGQGRVRAVGEAVAERFVDPSLPPRLREVMVPADHPGGRILAELMRAARERFPP